MPYVRLNGEAVPGPAPEVVTMELPVALVGAMERVGASMVSSRSRGDHHLMHDLLKEIRRWHESRRELTGTEQTEASP